MATAGTRGLVTSAHRVKSTHRGQSGRPRGQTERESSDGQETSAAARQPLAVAQTQPTAKRGAWRGRETALERARQMLGEVFTDFQHAHMLWQQTQTDRQFRSRLKELLQVYRLTRKARCAMRAAVRALKKLVPPVGSLALRLGPQVDEAGHILKDLATAHAKESLLARGESMRFAPHIPSGRDSSDHWPHKWEMEFARAALAAQIHLDGALRRAGLDIVDTARLTRRAGGPRLGEFGASGGHPKLGQPTRAAFIRAVLTFAPRASRDPAGWAYYGIGTGIEPPCMTRDAWTNRRRDWADEIDRVAEEMGKYSLIFKGVRRFLDGDEDEGG